MSLEFDHIAFAYRSSGLSRAGGANGGHPALRDISFTAPGGEITCLLGPSGCGKSTLLNLAAGLLGVQEGEIRIGGEVLAKPDRNPPPEARPVGLVFQDGALFPHMTLARNVAFGLASARPEDVDEWLFLVGLGGLGDRYPHQLSGGQQQRAALARAMAPRPAVLLMDEPFASVDIVLRRSLRRECRLLLRERRTTTLLVTHDPEEALDVADRIAVMEAGRIVQIGSPQELHEAPLTPSVGAMFRGAQSVRAHRRGEAIRSAFGAWPLECLGPADEDGVAERVKDDDAVDLLVQARSLRLAPDADGLTLRDLHPLGDRVRALLRHHSGAQLTAEIPVEAAAHLRAGARYRVTPDRHSVRAFPAQ